MNPQAAALQQRTHQLLVRVIELSEGLLQPVLRNLREQLLGAAGGLDSNYRAACRGRSRAEFIAKLGVAAEEADESLGWLLALQAAGYSDPEELKGLIREADELTAILTASQKTARLRNPNTRHRR